MNDERTFETTPTLNAAGEMEIRCEEFDVRVRVTKAEAMKVFNLIEREPPGFGMTKLTLRDGLKDAIERDLGTPCMNVNDWLNKVAREFLQAKCEPQPKLDAGDVDDCRRTLAWLQALGIEYDQDTPPTDFKQIDVSISGYTLAIQFDPAGKFTRMQLKPY